MTKVGVLDDVTLDFCEALDPATVTTTSVELLAPHATVGRKAVVVTYDDTRRRIVLHPSLPLAASATHRVRTTGLRTAAGTPIADVAFSFQTVRAPLIRREYALGAELCTLDAEGRIARGVGVGRGPDGKVGTPDDLIGLANTFVYSSSRTTEIISSQGPDGVWDTADDTITGVQNYEDSVLASYTRWILRTAGPDGLWLTADDGYSTMQSIRYTDDGRPAGLDTLQGPGPDGLPFTGDEPIQNYSTFLDLAPGQRRQIFYNKPGPDGQWRTNDDVVHAVYDHSDVDELGRARLIVYRHPGPDGIYLTPDDGIYQLHFHAYDSRGLKTSYRSFSNAGADKTWFTADDTPYLSWVYSYDPGGNLLRIADYGAIASYGSFFAPQL